MVKTGEGTVEGQGKEPGTGLGQSKDGGTLGK